jgi:nucleotide-binding universal stress UspA family protein
MSSLKRGEARSGGYDLIVMGTHGRRDISRFALGSDAENVVRMSPVPVLLVR